MPFVSCSWSNLSPLVNTFHIILINDHIYIYTIVYTQKVFKNSNVITVATRLKYMIGRHISSIYQYSQCVTHFKGYFPVRFVLI